MQASIEDPAPSRAKPGTALHELSIARSIVERVEEALDPGQRVLVITLEIGELSGVVEVALRFCFEQATCGTPLAGCRLAIEPVPVSLFCGPCHKEFQPQRSSRLVCPDCGQPSGELRRGRELTILSLEVSDEATHSRAS